MIRLLPSSQPAWAVPSFVPALVLALVPNLILCASLMPSHTQAQQIEPTEYGYDPEGNLTSIKDPLGRLTSREPDNLNRLKKQTLPAPSASASSPVISYTYDGLGRLRSIKDPRGNTTSYNYTGGFGDLDQSSPDTGQSTVWLDETGQPYYQKNARQAESFIDYDELNRPIRIASNTSGYSELVYDLLDTRPGLENYGRGRLTSSRERTNTGGVLSVLNLAYDKQGRITRRCQLFKSPFSCTNADTLFQRWGGAGTPDAGRLLEQTYPSGRKVGYQYNALGQISAITTTDAGSSTVQTVVRDVAYTPQAVAEGGYALTSLNFGAPGGTQAYQRRYDSSGRMETFTLGKGLVGTITNGTHVLTYNDAGVILDINSYWGAWTTATFDYDNLDRLTAMNLNGGNLFRYEYDANGNRTLKASYGSPTSYTYPAGNNRLGSMQAGQTVQTVQTVQSDTSGNITSDQGAPVGPVTFTYNDRIDQGQGKLLKSEGPQGQYTYAYNHLGQRIRKTGASYTSPGGVVYATQPYIGSTDTVFHYDTQGQLIAELDAATRQVKREYIWLGDMPVAVVAGANPGEQISASNAATVYYIHTDQLNTPRLVTDASKKKRWEWSPITSEPFGASAPRENPERTPNPYAFTLNLRFPGQYLDKETGSFYNYFRYYNPASGRYLQSDPIGLNGGLNTFLYGDANPLLKSDPWGLAPSPGDSSIYPPTQNCTCMTKCVAANHGEAYEACAFPSGTLGRITKIPGAGLPIGYVCQKIFVRLQCEKMCGDFCSGKGECPPAFRDP